MDTDTQNVVKKFQGFYRKSQRSPTYEEISEKFGFASTNTSYKLVQKLIGLSIPEHMLSIISSLTIFSKPLIVILKGQQ